VAALPTAAMLAGLVLGIEIVVRHTVNATDDPVMRPFGLALDASKPLVLLLAIVLLVGGFIVARWSWSIVVRAWDEAMTAARAKGFVA
jgi:branched-chain amino acid transport system permease protein